MRIAAVIVLSAAASASAQSVLIDFDDLTLGTTLGDQYLSAHGVNFSANAFAGPNTNNTAEPWATNTGITVTNFQSGSTTNPGYAVGSPTLYSGNFIRNIADYQNEDGDASVLATFQTPITSATLSFIGVVFFAAGAFDTQLIALDDANQPLASAHAVEAATTSQQNLTVTVPGGFSRLAIVPGNYNDAVGFDNLFFSRAAGPVTADWNVNAGGDYFNAANWSGNAIPNAAGATARFGPVITQSVTITYAQAPVVNRLIFDSASAVLLSPQAGATLNLSGAAPRVEVVQGATHRIGGTLASDTSLLKTGAGTVRIERLRAAGTLSIDGGTLRLGGAATTAVSRAASLVMGAQGIVSLNATGALVLDAAAPEQIRSLVDAGRLVTEDFSLRIGYAPGSELSFATLAGEAIAGTDLLLRATLPGDTDLDRDVDFDDLLTLAQSYGVADRHWYQGDFNADATVNFDDLLQLAQRYGTSALVDVAALTGAGFAPVAEDFARAMALAPEPGTALVLGLLPLTRRRRGALQI